MHIEITQVLLTLFYILVAAKIGGELAERIKQPAVLGELIAGVIVGSSVLGLVRESGFINILAQIGAIVLLFEAGITSDYESFMKVKLWAFIVACVGVAVPFILGYVVSHYFGLGVIESIFVGATLTATSVGITVRVFQDLGKAKGKEAQIVIGAAVVDDVIGLIILAAVIGITASGSVSIVNVAQITGLAVAFLGGGIVIGSFLAPLTLKFVHGLHVRGVLFVFAFAFCLIMAYFSQAVGLAPIVGAFAAGLILAGMLFLVAVAGKIVSGFAVFDKVNKWVIGVGMVPRGEVGFIFAAYGLSNKIIDQQLYTAILLVVILTTFVTPPILKQLLSKHKA